MRYTIGHSQRRHNPILAANMAAIIADRHMTPTDVARLSGHDTRTIYTIIDGYTCGTIDVLSDVCQVLDVNATWLMHGIGPMTPDDAAAYTAASEEVEE